MITAVEAMNKITHYTDRIVDNSVIPDTLNHNSISDALTEIINDMIDNGYTSADITTDGRKIISYEYLTDKRYDERCNNETNSDSYTRGVILYLKGYGYEARPSTTKNSLLVKIPTKIGYDVNLHVERGIL